MRQISQAFALAFLGCISVTMHARASDMVMLPPTNFNSGATATACNPSQNPPQPQFLVYSGVSSAGGQAAINCIDFMKYDQGTGNVQLVQGDFTLSQGSLYLTQGSTTLATGNLNLSQGSETLTAGNLYLTQGNETLNTGNVYVTNGNVSIGNSANTLTLNGGTISNNNSLSINTTVGNLNFNVADASTVNVGTAQSGKINNFSVLNGALTVFNSTGVNINNNQIWDPVGDLTLLGGKPEATPMVGFYVNVGDGNTIQVLNVPKGGICLNGSCITSWPSTTTTTPTTVTNISATPPVCSGANQALHYDGNNYSCATLPSTGGSSGPVPPVCNGINQVLHFDGTNYSCDSTVCKVRVANHYIPGSENSPYFGETPDTRYGYKTVTIPAYGYIQVIGGDATGGYLTAGVTYVGSGGTQGGALTCAPYDQDTNSYALLTCVNPTTNQVTTGSNITPCSVPVSGSGGAEGFGGDTSDAQ
jgi:hypothetical protein